ncbi:PO113 protein, partial [Vidua chalybeata]|nr:PO113 protein [Vidua chalybeata]
NSPTMCQLFVDWALQPVRRHFSNAIIYHYMDDILISTKQLLTDADLNWLILQLKHQGLTVSSEKVQWSAPWKYLGWLITDAQIRPQKITLHTDISTLHDAQRHFGDLQWVRTTVGITNDDLQPFLPWLHVSDANSPRVCTLEQQKALIRVSEKLQHGWSACCMEHVPLSLFLSNADACPLAIVFQWQKKKGESQPGSAAILLEWVFLSVQPKSCVMSRTDALAALIQKGRDRILEIDGKEPADISVPVKNEDLEWLLRQSVALQEALLGFTGVVQNKQPKGPMWYFIKRYQWLERPLCSLKPVEGKTVFTDAGRRTKEAVCVWQRRGKWLKYLIRGDTRDSLQTLELKAVCWALQILLPSAGKAEPLNVVSDSLYVAGVVQRIEDALLRRAQNQHLGELFLQLRSVLKQRQHVFCIMHIRSHRCHNGL